MFVEHNVCEVCDGACVMFPIRGLISVVGVLRSSRWSMKGW